MEMTTVQWESREGKEIRFRVWFDPATYFRNEQKHAMAALEKFHASEGIEVREGNSQDSIPVVDERGEE